MTKGLKNVLSYFTQYKSQVSIHDIWQDQTCVGSDKKDIYDYNTAIYLSLVMYLDACAMHTIKYH